MSDIKYYNKEGLQNLREELEHLISVERPSITQQIAEARDKGDLSENAEYDAAKEAQGMLEMRISKLQELIINSRLLDESKVDSSKVLLLSKVTLKNIKNASTVTYTIVPASEADLKQYKISVASPIAKGLLGKSVGEKVEILVPAGTMSFEIINISR